MKHQATIALLISAVLFPGATAAIALPAQSPQELPSAESILERFIEVTGGRAAYEKNRNQVSRGIVEVEGMGIRGTVQVYEAAPRNSYLHLELAGAGTIEEGTNGEVAWERSVAQGPRVKSGEERAVSLRNATFNGILRWQELYVKAENAGIENVQGQECYRVILTPEEGQPISNYFDLESGLLVKISGRYQTQMGLIPSETAIEDYRETEGLKVPRRLVQRVGAMSLRFQFEDVRFNVELPDDRFRLPEDVQALLPGK